MEVEEVEGNASQTALILTSRSGKFTVEGLRPTSAYLAR